MKQYATFILPVLAICTCIQLARMADATYYIDQISTEMRARWAAYNHLGQYDNVEGRFRKSVMGREFQVKVEELKHRMLNPFNMPQKGDFEELEGLGELIPVQDGTRDSKESWEVAS